MAKGNKITKLKIGPNNYTVTPRPIPISEGDSGNVLGRVIYSDCKIIHADNMAEDATALTILHESLHALLYHSGQFDQDERLVETLAGHLMRFIQDNPILIKRIQDLK